MSKELLLVVETVSNEKAVPEAVIFDALESALEAATRKKFDEEMAVRVEIDRRSGEHKTYRCWSVLADKDIENPSQELTLSQAQQKDPEARIGGVVEEVIENVEFGRIGAHQAKQIIIQKVREAERQKVYDEYIKLEGSIIHGIIKRVERGSVILDLGNNVEGIIFKENLIPRENTRIGDRMRVYIKQVQRENRGHQIVLSRTAPELLMELFKIEVPEIASGIIQIKGAARDPGMRAKIAVYSEDPRVDAAGACIGMRASRVQNITNELSGERIDVVIWHPDAAEFVINAIAPAEPVAIVVDEEKHSMDLAFAEDKVGKALGMRGQNVRLATELTGWSLNIMSEEAFAEKTGALSEKQANALVEAMQIDHEVAELLVAEGFISVETIAYGDLDELYAIEALDTDAIDALRQLATDILAASATGSDSNSEMIDTLPGISEDMLLQLKLNGIHTWDDVAELSTDELTDMTGLDEAAAAALILKAREPWFV